MSISINQLPFRDGGKRGEGFLLNRLGFGSARDETLLVGSTRFYDAIFGASLAVVKVLK